MLKVFRHRSLRWMIALSFIICHLSFTPVRAQIGTWRNYLSYAEPQQIQAAGNDLFVLASGSLYLYNKQDQSIHTYDKTNGMNDVDITHIKWCPQAKRLVVVYSNSNIDLVEPNGNVTNINDIYARAITGGKTIYSITISGQYAYLASELGIIKINVKNAEISETYILGFPVNAIALDNTNIYANSSSKGVWMANLTSNLIDPANWSQTTTSLSFDKDQTDYNDNIELVKTLKPEGPKYNHFFNMLVHDGQLYTVGGGWWQFDNFHRPGTIQILNNNKEWTFYQDNFTPAFATQYEDVNSIAIDPFDKTHVMVASCMGVIEFKDGSFKYNYTEGNTDYFKSAAGPTAYNYVRTDGIIYDKEGNLYCLNSGSESAIIKLNKNGNWSGFINNKLKTSSGMSLPGMVGSFFDSRGLMWFVNNHSDNPSFYCFNPESEAIERYENFHNQDGTNMDVVRVNSICEDKNGYIWVTTDKGPVYLTSKEIADHTLGVLQYKVPRNDGTDYADYLLANINTHCMAIDGGGRKWFGTTNNGVYLISADNNTQIHHFTSSNSPLLSDNIESIAINHNTGEVFFGTGNGLCSYMSDATTAANEMTDDNVYAYPNPVTPDYNGLITIVGLSYNADVKILSSNGLLIFEGRSIGGSFTWNGRDAAGNRVGSGIYMVATATSDGKKGVVCKIAIIK